MPQLKQSIKAKAARKRSFTLVELLVAMAISSLVLAGAYGVYISSVKIYRTNTTSSELTQNARVALERISREVRQSADIITSMPENPTLGTPAVEIKMQDGHNQWPGIGKIQYIRYYLSGSDLHRELTHYAFPDSSDDWVLYSTRGADNVEPDKIIDSDQIKAEQMSQIQFWGVKNITINIAVSDGAQTYHFETKALGRNIQ